MKIIKIISLLLCFALILTLAACGNKPAENEQADNKPAVNNSVENEPSDNKPTVDNQIESKPSDNKQKDNNEPSEKTPMGNYKVENDAAEHKARFIQNPRHLINPTLKGEAKIIYSVEDLKNYYNLINESEDTNSTGFWNVFEEYDDDYFVTNSLVVVTYLETFLASQDKYTLDSFYKGSEGKLFIGITVEQFPSSDVMSNWLLLIEAPKDLSVASDEDIIISREYK